VKLESRPVSTDAGRLTLLRARRCDVAVRDSLLRFVREDSAQDLVEYALLGVFIGVASVLVWQNISSLIGDRYAEYNSNVNTLWAPAEPP
jgi:Flp pilus assembly pilin Flp